MGDCPEGRTRSDSNITLERVLNEISFWAPDKKGEHVIVDAEYVGKVLADIEKNQDLSRYIL